MCKFSFLVYCINCHNTEQANNSPVLLSCKGLLIWIEFLSTFLCTVISQTHHLAIWVKIRTGRSGWSRVLGLLNPSPWYQFFYKTPSPAASHNCRYPITLGRHPRVLHWSWLYISLRAVLLHWPFLCHLPLKSCFWNGKNSSSGVRSWWDLLGLQTGNMNSYQLISITNAHEIPGLGRPQTCVILSAVNNPTTWFGARVSPLGNTL